MQESILDKIDSKNLVVHVVWTPVLHSDDHEAAVASSRELLQDPRVIHYWDGDQDLGVLYGKLLPLPSGRALAWDIYLVFEPGTRWNEKAPLPSGWAHQLAQDDRYLGDGQRYYSRVVQLLAGSSAAEPVR